MSPSAKHQPVQDDSADPLIPPGGDFLAALTPVLIRVREAFALAVDAVPAPIRTAADLRRALEIDTRLSTQIVRIARAPEVIAIASQIPGRPSLKRFLERAGELRIPAPLLREVDEAVGEFERFVQTHAGDRVRFDSIVSNLGAHGQDAIELHHRRAAFRAMCHLLGMQATAYTRACFFRRSDTRGSYDMAQIRGFNGITRLRPQTPVPLFSAQLLTTGADKVDGSYTRESIFPEIQPGLAIGAVRELSGHALESIRVIEEMGLLSAELHGDSLGNFSSTDLFFTYVERAVPVRPETDGSESFGINHSVSIPAERFVLDLFIEPGLLATPLPSASVYLNRTGRVATVHRPEDKLQVQPDLRRMRSRADLLDDPSLTSHTQAIEKTLAALGWDTHPFEIFRMTLDFPVVGTLMRIGAQLSPQNSSQSTN